MILDNRAFGVELEFSGGNLGRSGVLNILRSSFDSVGLRRWRFDDRLGYDGSEFELRTPILRGKHGFDQLELVMNTLYDAGCYVTEEDGLHIHHDAPEFTHNIDNCIKLVKSWNANRHLIYQFVSPDRTEDASYYDEDDNGYWACPGWTESQLAQMEKTRQIPHWSRNDLNLCSLPEHGSIEIRLHEGTLDYTEAEPWILFGQKFIDRVLKHRMYDSEQTEKLLKKVRVNPKAEKALINKKKAMYG